MTFVFIDNDTFEWPVEIDMPSGGSHVTIKITGHFRMIDDAEFLSADPDAVTRGQMIDAEIDKLCEVFTGWSEGDVCDPQKVPIAPTPDNIRRFLGKRPARLGVTAAYNQAITPTKGFRAKN